MVDVDSFSYLVECTSSSRTIPHVSVCCCVVYKELILPEGNLLVLVVLIIDYASSLFRNWTLLFTSKCSRFCFDTTYLCNTVIRFATVPDPATNHILSIAAEEGELRHIKKDY